MAGEHVPISVVPNPSAVNPGDALTVTVNLDGAPTCNETVTLSASRTGFFTDLPASVVVPANTSRVSFTVHTSASATGNASITASAAGGQASCTVVANAL